MSNLTRERLDHARLRLEHLGALADEYRQTACTWHAEESPAPPNTYTRTFRQTAQVPTRLGLVAGEVVFHARAALDNFAYEMVTSRATLTHDERASLSFPLTKTPEEFDNGAYRYAKAGQGLVVALRAVQPWAAYEDDGLEPGELVALSSRSPLFLASGLNNADKHRRPLTVNVASRPPSEATSATWSPATSVVFTVQGPGGLAVPMIHGLGNLIVAAEEAIEAVEWIAAA
jgi:hypothetical protein